jgi:hypothetical protein
MCQGECAGVLPGSYRQHATEGFDVNKATWTSYKGRSFMQREESPAMETGLERIAVKARGEPALRFASLAHYITQDRVWTNLWKIPSSSAAGVDGQKVPEAKESVQAVLRGRRFIKSRRGFHVCDQS